MKCIRARGVGHSEALATLVLWMKSETCRIDTECESQKRRSNGSVPSSLSIEKSQS